MAEPGAGFDTRASAGARDATAPDTDVLVIGAGPAGLAVAGCLVQRGLRPDVIEKGRQRGGPTMSGCTCTP